MYCTEFPVPDFKPRFIRTLTCSNGYNKSEQVKQNRFWNSNEISSRRLKNCRGPWKNTTFDIYLFFKKCFILRLSHSRHMPVTGRLKRIHYILHVATGLRGIRTQDDDNDDDENNSGVSPLHLSSLWRPVVDRLHHASMYFGWWSVFLTREYL